MFSPKFAWNDYFNGSPATTLNSSQYSSRQTPSVSNVYVLNCLFNRCILSSGNGGALYCSTSVTYLFVESSSFFSCRTNSGEGGAIHFYNTNGGQISVLYEVCCNDCCSTKSIGLFARIYIGDSASNKNYVNYTSIARCVDDTSNQWETLCLECGKIYCPSVNISVNKCKQQSGIYCHASIDSNYITCSLLYTTFADNSATNYICIYFNRGGPKHEIKCCNILRNTQVTLDSRGTIASYGNVMIEDSCILENTANCIFYSYSTSYSITLSNSTVDSTSYYNSFTIQNTVTKSFIHGLHHMTTQNCHSEYDSAGTLTAIPYVPNPTKKVFCYCYTDKINLYRARTNYLFSLHWVFIVTFIHPNPSGNF
jgi:hypothetical protein